MGEYARETKMSEEYDNEIEVVIALQEELNEAMRVGNYKKPNSLLDMLCPDAKEKNKPLEDSMIA